MLFQFHFTLSLRSLKAIHCTYVLVVYSIVADGGLTVEKGLNKYLYAYHSKHFVVSQP